MLTILILAFLLALLEAKSLKKQQRSKDLAYGGILLLIGLVLGVMQIRYVNVPSPLLGLKAVLGPIQAAVQAWFI